jgi:hypothetical protein
MTAHISARVGRLPNFQRISAYAVLALCAFSGAAYILGHELNILREMLASRSVLVTHGVSAFLMLIVIGSVLPTHVRVAWRARKNRLTGLLMFAVMAALAVSGLMLYYGAEESRDVSLWTHWLIGSATFLVFPLHAIIGREAKRRKH